MANHLDGFHDPHSRRSGRAERIDELDDPCPCLRELRATRSRRAELAAAWLAQPREAREIACVVSKLHDRGACTGNIAWCLWLAALIMIAMPVAVLAPYYRAQLFTETVCNNTRDVVVYPFCRGGTTTPCGRATATAAGGQTVVLRFPSFSEALEVWTRRDFTRWQRVIAQPNFTCFVRGSADVTAGMVSRRLPGLRGWLFMAGLAGALLAASIATAVLRGVRCWQHMAARRKALRMYPSLGPLLGLCVSLHDLPDEVFMTTEV